MPATEQHASEIVNKVKQRLAQAEREGIYLEVQGDKFEDDWLYIVVAPSRAGVRASEYANYMSKLERELRGAGDNDVVLVPALNDDGCFILAEWIREKLTVLLENLKNPASGAFVDALYE